MASFPSNQLSLASGLNSVYPLLQITRHIYVQTHFLIMVNLLSVFETYKLVYFWLSFYFFCDFSGTESFRVPRCNSVHNESEGDLPPDQLKALYEVLHMCLGALLIDLCSMEPVFSSKSLNICSKQSLDLELGLFSVPRL